MTPSDLPIGKDAWIRAVLREQLSTSGTLESIETQSASKIGLRQYLMLRVIYKELVSAANLVDAIKKNADLAEPYAKAKADLKRSEDFQKYFNSFDDRRRPIGGVFAMAKLYQNRSSERPEALEMRTNKIFVHPYNTRSQRERQFTTTTPTKQPRQENTMRHLEMDFDDLMIASPETTQTPYTPDTTQTPSTTQIPGSQSTMADFTDPYSVGPLSHHRDRLDEAQLDLDYQAAEDEQIVNFALILLLDSLIHKDNVQGAWSPYRFPMICYNDKGRLYEARVDGVFRPTSSSNSEKSRPTMIVEVKANSRSRDATVVAMQEAAQIAAWISHQRHIFNEQIKDNKYQ